jgi:hypothetical protein
MGAETVSTAAGYLQDIKRLFKTYKDLGDKSFAQLRDEDVHWKVEPESNSIANIVMHISGNFLSRWTDFLTTDGEKPWRNRDGEFEDPSLGKEEILGRWEQGWTCLFSALAAIDEGMLTRVISIRGEQHTLIQALDRSLTHCAYHVGQMVFIAKARRSGDWQSLSIPKGKSQQFNAGKAVR